MNKNNMRIRDGLFFALIKNNVIRTVVGILMLLVTAALFLVLVFVKITNIPEFRIEEQMGILRSGDFESLDVNEINRGNGTIEILNEELNIVYSTGVENQYTNEDIEQIIPISLLGGTFTKTEYYENDQLLILYSAYSEDKGSYLVVDEFNRYVDSNNFSLIKEVYEEVDFAYITESYLENSKLFKFEFDTVSGENHILLLQFVEPVKVVSTAFEASITTGLWLSIIAYIAFMVWSIRSLSKKIKEPLETLDNAMFEFSEGNYDNILEYTAVNELSSIMNTFNQMVEKLNTADKENKRLIEDRERLIADIAHDLKTPITITRGYAKALIDGKIDSKEHHDYYEKVYNKTTELNNLIDVFANYSKLSHPEFTLSLESVNITEFFRTYLANNYNYIVDKGFIVENEIPETELYCLIDIVHFRRVLDNILSNFIKYNPKETSFDFEVKRKKKSCIIIFRNNGPKIEESLIGELFKPFTMADQSRTSNKNSGLGLATVQKILTLHNGSIEYNEKELKKNEFIIRLQLAR